MEKQHEGVGERLIQHKAKLSAVFGSRTCQSAIFLCGSALTDIKCFLVWTIHLVNLNCIGFSHQTIGKCLYNTSLVTKQADNIVLATSWQFKMLCM